MHFTKTRFAMVFNLETNWSSVHGTTAPSPPIGSMPSPGPLNLCSQIRVNFHWRSLEAAEPFQTVWLFTSYLAVFYWTVFVKKIYLISVVIMSVSWTHLTLSRGAPWIGWHSVAWLTHTHGNRQPFLREGRSTESWEIPCNDNEANSVKFHSALPAEVDSMCNSIQRKIKENTAKKWAAKKRAAKKLLFPYIKWFI